ncbi:hypothetical protein [Halorubrum xinjiangense]|uniref:hypothetical protein n=1 Tax=Halorubrum xinjiangense TaxID=261291 RepID=UPI001660050C|nr:hypothetical protein [Halorubrum xinjiangense]
MPSESRILTRQRLRAVDLLVRDRADLDVLGPLAVVVAEELPKGLPVVPERSFRHLALVLVPEEQLVDIRPFHVDQRGVGALGAETEVGAVVDIRARGEVPLGVLVADELLDRLSVALVDVRAVELPELVLELVAEIVDVAHACHKYQKINTKNTRWLRLRQTVELKYTSKRKLAFYA